MKNLTYIMVVLVIASCTKQIPFTDPGTEQKLVLNALIEPNDFISVNVSGSASILRPGDVKVITDAQVSLFEDGDFVGDLQVDENDTYTIEYAPLVGKEYELVAVDDTLGTVSSTTTIPAAIGVSNITIEETTNVDDDTIYRVEFDLDDPDGDNYYILHVVESQDGVDQWGHSFFSAEPYFQGGSQDNYFWNGAAFRDNAFNGQKQRITFDLSYIDTSFGSTYSILLISATEEHFLYHVSYKAFQDSNGDPFSQPVQIYSNVENGLGIFAGHNKTYTEIPY